MSSLANYLHLARTRANLTQRQVAKRLKFKSQFVSNWEMGKSEPPLSKIEQLAKIYDVPASLLTAKIIQQKEQRYKTKLEGYVLSLDKTTTKGMGK